MRCRMAEHGACTASAARRMPRGRHREAACCAMPLPLRHPLRTAAVEATSLFTGRRISAKTETQIQKFIGHPSATGGKAWRPACSAGCVIMGAGGPPQGKTPMLLAHGQNHLFRKCRYGECLNQGLGKAGVVFAGL